ncbi:MAG: glutamine amidotransferase [Thermoguttaceae bacterium]
MLILILGYTLFLLPPKTERFSSSQRKGILRLRLCALALLSLLLLRPSLLYTESKILPASLFLLLDHSESMSVKDEISEQSRFGLAQSVLQGSAPSLKKIQDRLELLPFLFDATLQPLMIQFGHAELPESPTGQETAIGSALLECIQKGVGKRLLGIVLLSDGTQKARPPRDALPRDAATALRDANVPIFSVPFGKSGSTDSLDVAVQTLIAAEHLFVKNELPVSGLVRVNGYLNQPIPIRLLAESNSGNTNSGSMESGSMEVVATEMITATEEGQLVPYKFSYIPDSCGLKKITVDIPALPKEGVVMNNQMSTFVRVLEGGLNVLYIEGSRRTEQRFLRKSLDSSADIHLVYYRFPVEAAIALAQDQGQQGKTAEQILVDMTTKRPSLKEELFSPGKFSAYIIGDVDALAWKTEELQGLVDSVRNGAGLIMLGGMHSFGAGGYAETPLAELLPVSLDSLDRQKLGETIREDVHLGRSLGMRPSKLGRSHFILRLSGNTTENQSLWESLPQLRGGNRIKPKQAAFVLAEGEQQEPLLVQQMFGTGRVLAFAGDTTWDWVKEHETEHKRFWRQVILWLAKMDESVQGTCWIELDKVRYYPGEPVPFRVHFRHSQGEEIRNPQVNVRVLRPDGQEEAIPILYTQDSLTFPTLKTPNRETQDVENEAKQPSTSTSVHESSIPTGSVRQTEMPGDYTILATVQADGEQEEAINRFLVYDHNIELDNPTPDPALLSSLSQITGGRTIPPESLPTFLEELVNKSSELVEKRDTRITLYDTWPVLLLLIAVLSLEWFLRKRWGEV